MAYHARSSRRSNRANRKTRHSPGEGTEASVTFKVRRACPSDVRLALLGEGELLGKWDTSKVHPLRRTRADADLWEWVVAVPIGVRLTFKVNTNVILKL